jgi:hypothetical protein
MTTPGSEVRPYFGKISPPFGLRTHFTAFMFLVEMLEETAEALATPDRDSLGLRQVLTRWILSPFLLLLGIAARS